jgi:hypothetical protein
MYIQITGGMEIVTSKIYNRIYQWSYSSAREQALCFNQRSAQTRLRALSHDVTPQEITSSELLMFDKHSQWGAIHAGTYCTRRV